MAMITNRMLPMVMKHIELVHAVDRPFGQAEVMDGIQQIGFTAAIDSHKAIDILGKLHFRFLVILKLLEADIFEVHA